MVLSSVLAFARAQSQTDINGLTDDNGIIFANEANYDFHRRLIEKGVDASGLQETSILGVANQGVYNYPSNPSLLALKTIEVNYANNTASNHIVAHQVDVANLPESTSFGWLRSNTSTVNPLFDDRGDRYEIFPTPTTAHNLTNLIRMFYYAQPSIYSTSISTVNYPENLDPAILGWRVAANYATALQNTVMADYLNSKYQERVDQYISTLSRGSQQPIQANTIPLTGFEF